MVYRSDAYGHSEIKRDGAKPKHARTAVPAYPPPCQRESPAQQRARRQSPCTHANRSPEGVPAPPQAVHSCAEPEEPRRSAGAPQARAAPSKSRPGRVWSAREWYASVKALTQSPKLSGRQARGMRGVQAVDTRVTRGGSKGYHVVFAFTGALLPRFSTRVAIEEGCWQVAVKLGLMSR